MIRTIDFNSFPAGTVVDDEYLATDGVTVSAVGGSGLAMLFDSNNPTGDDDDLGSDTLDGLLIISEDGDSDDPDDFDGGGSIFFDFEDLVRVKSLTFKDIEETDAGGAGARMIFYNAAGEEIESQFVPATGDGGESTVQLAVDGVARMEVVLPGSGAIDNLVFDDCPDGDEGPTAVDDSAETDEDTAVIIDLRGNDTDPNNTNDELTIGGFVSADGEVVDNGDGTVTFTPDENFNGETTFTYTVTDPDGNSDEGEVTVLVGPVNDDPVANPDEAETTSGAPVIIDVRGNDTDVETPTEDLTIGSFTSPDGEVVNNGDGTITFTPDDDFVGTATIGYELTDPDGGSDTGEITVEVDVAPDLGPTAVPDFEETDEDTSVIVDLLGNDTDPDNTNDELTLEAVSVSPDEGTVEDLGDGTVRFTPAQDFNGEATISYAVSDPDGNTDDGTAFVTVNPINDAPIANDDEASTEVGEPVVVDLRGNDTDVETPTEDLVISDATSLDGEVVDNGDGTVTFTPADGFTGDAIITYTVSDLDGGSDDGTATVSVANNGPTAVDDVAETPEDEAVIIDLLGNDTDPDNDNDELTLADVSVPADQGEVVDNGDGTVTFTPAMDFNGEATISYTVSDPDGNTDDGEAVVTVVPVNDPPVTMDDELTTDEDTPSEPLNVLENDSDPEGGDLELVSATSPDGDVRFTPEGEVVFTPDPDFNGTTTIEYFARDPEGLETPGIVNVTVNPINDAPVAVDDSDETDEEVPVVIDLLANDTDVDNDTDELTVISATVDPAEGELVEISNGVYEFTPADDFTGIATVDYIIADPDGLTDDAVHTIDVGNVNDAPITEDDELTTDEDTPSEPLNVLENDSDPDGDPLELIEAESPDGDVSFTPEGEVVFTPDPDFNGTTTIEYVVRDPAGEETPGIVNVTVNPVNDAPDAVDDVDVTPEDTPITVDLLANDTDVDGDDLTVTAVSVPADQGEVVDNGDGTATFTPNPDFVGEVTISYTIEDEEGLTDSAEHTVYVNEVSDAPVTEDDAAETPEDTPITVDVLENDSDPDGDPLIISEASVPPEQGTVEIVDDELVFTPAENFNGPATITYTAQDPDGNSTPGELVVDVTPVNDAPVAEDDTDVTDINTAVTVDLLANDSDVDGDDLTVTSASVPTAQGTISLNGDGTALFTPATDFTGEATISYTIRDEEGLTDSAEHTVIISDPDEAPTAVDDTAETPEDTPVTVDVLDNDTDPQDDPLSIREASIPEEQGTVEIVDDELVFTPAENFNGPAEITYVVEDPDGNADEGTVTVNVTPVNDAPEAVDDEDTTEINTPITVNLIENDSDPEDDTLTVTEATVPADQGTIVNNGDGTALFTPAMDFVGEATISYTIDDGNGGTDSAEHVVTIEDNGPEAVDDTAQTPQETPVTVPVLANDTDPNDDPLTVTAASVPADQGSVEIVDDEVVFTPADGFTGPATITYTVEDPDGNEDEGEVVVDVTPPTDGVNAQDDVAMTEEDTPVVVDLVNNDIDPEGDPLTVTSVEVPVEEGTVVDNGDGTATFTPAPNFVGEATITYTVEDPDGDEDTAVHVVTVTPINDAPVAMDDVEGTAYNTPIEDIPVLDNDEDVDGDPLRVVEASSPDGDVEINPDGTLNFTPTPGFTGPAEITYTISDRPEGDPEGLTDEGTLIIQVAEPGDRDGIVEGTPEDDLIDTDYAEDPDGDFIDNEDAIIPGEEPNDDIVRAGDGDDTVEAGEGSDDVDGGDGDDVINTGNGDLAPDEGYPFSPDDSLGFPGDLDPENDRDSVDGGAGNDTITTGDDADTITGGAGDDVIDGGIDDDVIDGNGDDDRIVGGEGDDTIDGGSGNDTIYAGNDPDGIGDLLDIEDEESDDAPFSPDRNPDNGRDSVDGGAGDDLIFGADDDDTLNGGTGNDTIDGQIDDDIINGNIGDDSLIGGQGDDSVTGGQGDDTLEGGEGDDTLRGNLNDDTLLGGDGDDVLDGGGQNDLLEGGDGDDSLQGAQGDDTLRGGEGDDTMTGGAGQDVFENVNAGDDVDGGSGPVDFDTLDLRGSAPEGGSFSITYTSDDQEDGIVNYLDEDGNDAGELVFEEIENIIPCFTPGTKIATPKGERLVEELRVGDRVITRDNGIQEIRWTGAREMSGAELERAAHLKPVLIQQGALGNDLPERDMMVSPNHRVLVANDKTALYFEEREVLVAAKHLTGLEGVDIVDVSATTYIHIMFDQHEVILSDGAWTESFQPGDMSLAGIGNAQRQEILELFPELATEEGIEGYASARRSLKKHEAKLITD
ncbi:MAG: tandem-95 repeat protein [Sulfitobacter sp.]